MKIRRTANAGVLLAIDGISILLDGVCGNVFPYEQTPEDIKKELSVQLPDAVLYTHYHDDHYDSTYAQEYKSKTLRSVYGPEFALLGKLGSVKVQAVPTRHIGKTDIEHVSYIISGSSCVWFMGDASPLDVKNIKDVPRPDVLIVPYAYVITSNSWQTTKSLGAKKIILLHMPPKDNDPHMLWQQVEETTKNAPDLMVPKMNETIEL